MAGRENTDGLPACADLPDEPYYFADEEFQPSDCSALVVEAIAAATGLDPTSTEIPLSRAVNPDALNDLFDTHEDGEPRNVGQVSFRLWGLNVTVTSDGYAVVRPPEPDEAVLQEH